MLTYLEKTTIVFLSRLYFKFFLFTLIIQKGILLYHANFVEKTELLHQLDLKVSKKKPGYALRTHPGGQNI
ncbi:MAG: hypothetical protein D3910_13855 [Candidatus Electrothrix sp. ATG2]|nr:hypothetical protein [Candidatus Electrothrix sp. ATG2]